MPLREKKKKVASSHCTGPMALYLAAWRRLIVINNWRIDLGHAMEKSPLRLLLTYDVAVLHESVLGDIVDGEGYSDEGDVSVLTVMMVNTSMMLRLLLLCW